jgi:hypothetical protein
MTGSAKQSTYPLAALWIASSQALLAMTAAGDLSAIPRRAKALRDESVPYRVVFGGWRRRSAAG